MTTRIVRPKRMSELYGVESASMDTKIYPKITLSLSDLPEAKDWEVGEDYVVELTLRQVSKQESEKSGSATFEIRKVGIDDDEDEDLSEEDDNEKE